MSNRSRRHSVPTGQRSRRTIALSSLPVVARSILTTLLAACASFAAAESRSSDSEVVEASPPNWTLQARLVASHLTGAHGVRQVGRFHSGGPFTGNPEFLMSTQRGRVL